MAQLRKTWKTSEPKILGVNCDSLTYLGIVCCYERVTGALLIHQIPYICDMLDKYREFVPLRTSKQPGQVESFADSSGENEEVSEEKIAEMRAALGAILWVVTRTRPDLAWSH
eukprot:2614025-Amphidinium_carterae.1